MSTDIEDRQRREDERAGALMKLILTPRLVGAVMRYIDEESAQRSREKFNDGFNKGMERGRSENPDLAERDALRKALDAAEELAKRVELEDSQMRLGSWIIEALRAYQRAARSVSPERSSSTAAQPESNGGETDG